MVKTICPQCRGSRFDPWAGTKISQARIKSSHATAKTQCTPENKKAPNIVGNFLAVHASIAEDTGSVPGWRTKILQATCCGQKKPPKNRGCIFSGSFRFIANLSGKHSSICLPSRPHCFPAVNTPHQGGTFVTMNPH